MAKIMEIIEKETRGKSYHTYKYSYDSIGLPSIDYDDDPNKIIKWKDSGETASPKKSINLKQLADQLQEVGETSLFKYFLDGSRHVFKVDDIAYINRVFFLSYYGNYPLYGSQPSPLYLTGTLSIPGQLALFKTCNHTYGFPANNLKRRHWFYCFCTPGFPKRFVKYIQHSDVFFILFCVY